MKYTKRAKLWLWIVSTHQLAIDNGLHLSTPSVISPCIMDDGDGDYNQYVIAYTLSDIKDMDMAVFAKTLNTMFHDNVPDTLIEVIICKHVQHLTDWQLFGHFCSDFVEALQDISDLVIPWELIRINDTGPCPYNLSSDTTDMVSESDEDEDEDESLLSLLESFGVGKEKSGKKKKKGSGNGKKNSKKSYPNSKAMRDVKQIKKDFKKHNIVIATKKNYINDAEIVYSFLKDFIPGKSDWIKEYRKEILDRWMGAFIIKEKDARKREKEFRESMKKKSSGSSKKSKSKGSSSIARRYDPFYDPEK